MKKKQQLKYIQEPDVGTLSTYLRVNKAKK